ncbi:MAG: hypothetical protein ACOYK8_02595 [Alphaproteobacteria bacterium]
MKKCTLFLSTVAILSLLLVAPQPVKAEEDGARRMLREKLEHLSPQQREEFKRRWQEHQQRMTPHNGRGEGQETFKERLEHLSPEQRKALLAKIKEKLQNMPPEKREALRERLKERLHTMPSEPSHRLKPSTDSSAL